jgi:hypothetical protein
MSEDAGRRQANYIYYFVVGLGDWKGIFEFRLTSWSRFRAQSVGWKNRFLALSLIVIFKLIGSAPITSHLEGDPHAGQAGVVANRVRISKLGMTLYLLNEHYYLDPDGRLIHVEARERFGPIPFLFNHRKEHPAEATENGRCAVYYIPLLGSEWTATYHVSDDRRHIYSTMVGDWGEGHEIIHKLGSQPASPTVPKPSDVDTA